MRGSAALAFSLACYFSLAGCGKLEEKFGRQRAGETTVHFRATGPGAVALNGKVLVYLVGADGNPVTLNGVLDSDTSGGSISAPNGVYKVGAVGWAGLNVAEGGSYCGYGFGDPNAKVILAGSAVTVPIPMAFSNCYSTTNDIIFNDQNGGYNGGNLTWLYLKYCSSMSVGSCTVSNTHDTKYAKFAVDIYRRHGDTQSNLGRLELGCSLITGGTAATVKRIPLGTKGAFPKIFSLTFSLHAAADSSCTQPPLLTYEARNGLVNGATSGTANSMGETSGSYGYLKVIP